MQGFCFGVKQAIEKGGKSSGTEIRAEIYSMGSLIHNERVTRDLGEKRNNV